MGLSQDPSSQKYEFDPIKLVNEHKDLALNTIQDYTAQMYSVATDLVEKGITDRKVDDKTIIYVTKPNLNPSGRPAPGTYTAIADYMIQRRMENPDKSNMNKLRTKLAKKVSLRGDKDSIVGKEANIGGKKTILVYVDEGTIEDITDQDKFSSKLQYKGAVLKGINDKIYTHAKTQIKTPARSTPAKTPQSPSISSIVDFQVAPQIVSSLRRKGSH